MLKQLSGTAAPLFNLFKPGASSGAGKPNDTILFLVTIILSIAVLILRSPGALVHPQFWAEDGSVFFQDAYNLGAQSFTKSYAGYFHLIPRTVAYITAVFVPYAYAPVAYVVASLAGFIVVVSYIWRRTGLDLHARFLMCLAITLVPIESETVLNLTNLQWYTALLPIIIVLSPSKRKKLPSDLLVIFFVSLTGPFSLVIFPAVALFTFLNSRVNKVKKVNVLIVGILGAGAVIQLLSILTNPSRVGNNIGISGMLYQLPYVVYIHLLNIPGLLRLYTSDISYPVFAVLLIATGVWIYLCFRQFQKDKDLSALFLVCCAFTLIAANLYGFDAIKKYYKPTIVGRYFLLPSVLLIWSAVLYNTRVKRSYLPLYILFGWYLTILLSRLEIFRFGKANVSINTWQTEAKKIDQARDTPLIIKSNPEGFFIRLEKNEKKR